MNHRRDESNSPEEYVREHRDQLERLIRESNNTFVRALALAAFVEYGPDVTISSLEEDIRRLKEVRENEEQSWD